jgi:ornithine decarboxylase
MNTNHTPIDEALTRKLPTPFVVVDPSIACSNLSRFHNALPGIEPFYAIKANRDSEIIKAVDSQVAGYDVASLGEIQYLMGLGVATERIVYSNPVKIPSHIEKAYELGVRYFAFDSLDEIKKLAQYAPGSNVYLRLIVSDEGSKFPLSRKFGAERVHAIEYCSIAAAAGLNVRGVAFHVGSQSENIRSWAKAIKVAGEALAELKSHGFQADLLNICGGFPANYGQPIPSLEDIGAAVTQAIADFVPKGTRVIAEPGRFVAAETSAIATTVIARERRGDTDWLYIDMGAFQGLMEVLEYTNWKYPVFTTSDDKANRTKFMLSGPTCDACDTLGNQYVLPADIKIGDRIVIGSAGAYTLVYASDFNGFSVPKTYYARGEG